MKRLIRFAVIFASAIIINSCASDDLSLYQKNEADKQFKLFEMLDEFPALKSSFDNVDPVVFNVLMDRLVREDPELGVIFLQKTASTLYGDTAVLPGLVKDMSSTFRSYHDAFVRSEDSFENAFNSLKDLITIDSSLMSGGIKTISGTLSSLKNVDEAVKRLKTSAGRFALDKSPVACGSFRVWVDNTLTGKDDGFGKIIRESDGAEIGEIHYVAGVVEFTPVLTGTTIECRYGAVSNNKWDLFNDGQEFSNLGYNGVTSLIDTLDILSDFYSKNPDIEEPSIIINNFLTSLQTSPMGIEAKIKDISAFLADPELAQNEKDLADWMIADREKVSLLNYYIKYFHPITLDPVLEGADVPSDFENISKPYYLSSEDDYKNIIRRTRWILDEAAFIYGASPRKLTGSLDDSETLFLKTLAGGLRNDIEMFDNLEEVPMFDFVNNPMLNWSENLVKNSLNPALSVIPKERFQQILWNGWTYISTSGTGSPLKGIFRVGDPDMGTIHAADGYVTRMAKTKSSDPAEKSFRNQVNEILNGGENGTFKNINLSYDTSARSESQLESIVSNLYLYILSHYFEPVRGKWAFTPADSKLFFPDDPNNSIRNLQTLFGNMSTSIRNIAVLDKNGNKPVSGQETLSMMAEVLYLLAAASGLTDPVSAPPELTLKNCLSSMGSPLADLTYVTIPLINQKLYVIGNNTSRRLSVVDNPNPSQASESSWPVYATQHEMTALELLQPGTYRTRVGNLKPAPDAEVWHGRFSSSQGDIRGISDGNGNIVTSNWSVTEVALAAWEGYGPYTYMGRAPNGSECKYKNSWYSDWYYIQTSGTSTTSRNKAPGISAAAVNPDQKPHDNTATHGRYSIYEKIYRPTQAELVSNEVWRSAYRDSNNNYVPKIGFVRSNNTDGTYNNVDTASASQVVLDCSSREEAIRKNFNWLMNEKKYMFMIPMQGVFTFFLGAIDLDLAAYATIHANGIVGIAKAKRSGNDIGSNAKWGSGLSSSRHWRQLAGKFFFIPFYLENIVPAFMSEDGTSDRDARTFRFKGVSFDDQDYMIAIDYVMYLKGWAAGISSEFVDMLNLVWQSLGGNPVLPGAVGENIDSFSNLGNILYLTGDIISNGYASDVNDVKKFRKFYDDYYGDAGLFNGSGDLTVRADELPPVPRVNGVSYPTAYDELTGLPLNDSWIVHTGESKGKFEDILGILTAAVGTMHEDGDVYRDIQGNTLANNNERHTGVLDETGEPIAYFAKTGFRANIDNLVMMIAALNEHQKASGSNLPAYKIDGTRDSWISMLVDHDGTSVVPGSRQGVLPKLLSSKYLNINNPGPVKEGIEGVIRHTIRSYFNSFDLTKGFTENVWEPGDWAPLDPLYKFDLNNNKVIGIDGYAEFNPDIDWDIPINKLRYFLSDRSIDQFERMLDYLRDLSEDVGTENRPAFREVVDQTITAVNTLLRIRHNENNSEGDPFYIKLSKEDIDNIIEFLQKTDYSRIFSFIKEKKLNDLEKFYNFTIDDWMDSTSEEELRDMFDEVNKNMVKFFGSGIKDSLFYGVYKIKDKTLFDAKLAAEGLPAEWAVEFAAGDVINGFGKYIEIEKDIYDNGGLYPDSVVFEDVFTIEGEEPASSYYEYLDISSIIRDLDNKVYEDIFEVTFPGLTEVFTVRTYGKYKDNFFRGGIEDSPNMFSFHIYDIRLDKAFDVYNKYLVEELTADVFAINQPTEYKALGKDGSRVYNRPTTFIDWLYGRGHPQGILSIEHEINFFKDLTFKTVLDDETITLPDPDTGDEVTDTPRNFVGLYRDFLVNNLFEYEYERGGSKFREKYSPDYEVDVQDGHLHVINNVLEVIAVLFDRNSSDYVTGKIYDFWEAFLVEARDKNITTETLTAMRESFGALLFDTSIFHDINGNGVWDDETPYLDENLNGIWDAGEPLYTDSNSNGKWDVGEPLDYNGTYIAAEPYGAYNADTEELDTEVNYSQFIAKLADKIPAFLEIYKGNYDELIRIGILAFEPGGIGEYMMENMRSGEQYEMLDYINEIDMLLNQDVFQSANGRDTFWWQVGSMTDAFAVMIADKNGYNSIDYSAQILSIFK